MPRNQADELLWDGPKRSAARVLLAHGAGAGMESPFMTMLARALAERGVGVARFEFPYMRRRRQG
ncbi:MAG TPA: alpha/beta family hydrolase, partial [Polyangiales bacterium]|nr:alpha/beta family hydrolase [Polyangiales bacterium]